MKSVFFCRFRKYNRSQAPIVDRLIDAALIGNVFQCRTDSNPSYVKLNFCMWLLDPFLHQRLEFIFIFSINTVTLRNIQEGEDNFFNHSASVCLSFPHKENAAKTLRGFLSQIKSQANTQPNLGPINYCQWNSKILSKLPFRIFFVQMIREVVYE